MARTSIIHDDWLWLTAAWFLVGLCFSIYTYINDQNARFAEVEFQPTNGILKHFSTFETCGEQGCRVIVNMQADYSVGSQQYTTSRFSLGHISAQQAQATLSAFKSGNTEVRIWFNPQHPEEAVIQYDKRQSRLQFLIFLAFAITPLSITLLCRALNARRIS